MRCSNSFQPRYTLVNLRVVLHRAGSQRIHAGIDAVIPAGKAGEMANHIHLADFREIGDPVVFLKKATGGLGAEVCIDAVGADASGNGWHTLFGKKLKLEAGSAVPVI